MSIDLAGEIYKRADELWSKERQARTIQITLAAFFFTRNNAEHTSNIKISPANDAPTHVFVQGLGF